MKNNIIFVTSSLSAGGAQRSFANTSLGLPDDWKCTFVLNNGADITYQYKGEIIDLGFREHNEKNSFFYTLKLLMKRIRVLRKLKKTGEYKACISGFTSANVANILSGKGCPIIVSERNLVPSTTRSRTKELLNRIGTEISFKQADAVVAISDKQRLELIKEYKLKSEKIVTIYNGYILSLFQDDGKDVDKYVNKHYEPVISTMGRLIKQKGQWHLIKAMQSIIKEFPDATLIILGKGINKEKLESLAQICEVNNNVEFVGFCSNPHDYIRGSDVYVMPSLWEGFGNALVEAMCCGIPVISTDYDAGAREILAPNTDVYQKVHNSFEKAEFGILVPEFDQEEDYISRELNQEEIILAHAIMELLEDSVLRNHYKNKSVERANDFSIESNVASWITLINSLQEKKV